MKREFGKVAGFGAAALTLFEACTYVATHTVNPALIALDAALIGAALWAGDGNPAPAPA